MLRVLLAAAAFVVWVASPISAQCSGCEIVGVAHGDVFMGPETPNGYSFTVTLAMNSAHGTCTPAAGGGCDQTPCKIGAVEIRITNTGPWKLKVWDVPKGTNPRATLNPPAAGQEEGDSATFEVGDSVHPVNLGCSDYETFLQITDHNQTWFQWLSLYCTMCP